MPVNLTQIAKKHTSFSSDGSVSIPRLEGFAEACYDQNTIEELLDAVASRSADSTDCKNWGIMPSEWRYAIEEALTAKLLAAGEIYIIKEVQNAGSERKGELFAGDLTTAMRAAVKNQMFQGTTLKIENCDGELAAIRTENKWEII